MQKGFGSITPVSVLDCQIACESAAGCDAFSYNSVQRQCFLKNGASRTTCTVSVLSPAVAYPFLTVRSSYVEINAKPSHRRKHNTLQHVNDRGLLSRWYQEVLVRTQKKGI